MKSKEEPVISDLASFKPSYFFHNEPIPPILFELVALLAVMAADADCKTFLETGVWPTIDDDGKEGSHV